MLTYSRISSCLAAGVLALVAASDAVADCNDNFMQTKALSVLEQGGQGNLSCGDFIGPGGQMNDITSNVSIVASPTPNPLYPHSIDWIIAPGSGLSADRVIVEAADGRRCVYAYKDGTDGINLSPAGSKSVKSVFLCSDGLTTASPPPPVEPISTVENGCYVGDGGSLVDLQNGVDNDDAIAVVVGFGDTEEGAVTAVCADTSDSGGVTRTQVKCDDRCLVPDGWVPESNMGASGVGPYSLECAQDTATLTPAQVEAGEVPLSCRSCELSNTTANDPPTTPAGVEFCWELTHSVDRIAETFVPPVELEESTARVRRYQGSRCYLTTTSFYGVAYSYWICI